MSAAPDPLTDAATAAALNDEAWVALHAPRFRDIRPRYELFTDFLKATLKRVCAKLAPLGLVEARPKGIPSFCEKILRKRPVYTDPRTALPPDPLVRMTDLCGARVIVQTTGQVQTVCDFIERNFVIDWPNSEDVSRRLRTTEFGYRSVHYIVSFDPSAWTEAEFRPAAPDGLAGLKAEIQVRTLLEHAWADIGHDMTYKTDLRIPALIQRQSAALAAILEATDREFGRLVETAQQYQSNFGAYHEPASVRAEIARLRIVLQQDPDNADLALRIGRLALAIGDHDTVRDTLSRRCEAGHPVAQRVLGMSLCEAHRGQPTGPGFAAGRTLLEAACAHPSRDAEALVALAEAWMPDDEERARALFREAVAADPGDPIGLVRHLEFEIARQQGAALAGLVAPMVREAIRRGRMRIEAGVDLPRTYAALAILHLLLDEPHESLAALSGAIRLGSAGGTLPRLRETLLRLKGVAGSLSGHVPAFRLLQLGMAVRLGDARARAELAARATAGSAAWMPAPGTPPVLIAGGCSAACDAAIGPVFDGLRRAFGGLEAVVIGGGTRAGVAGLAGDLARDAGGRIRALGYVPGLVPAGTAVDEADGVVRIVRTDGHGFSAMESLQAWTDLVAAGVPPARVKLLGIGGGDISHAEYAVGLALGAQVALVEGTGLPAARAFETPPWAPADTPLRLPFDAMTLRAFLLVNELPAERKEFEAAARRTHEEYLKSARSKEPSLQPWEKLPPVLRLSNFHQVAYAENILRGAGLGVRPCTDPAAPLLDMTEALGEAGIRRLAEMEHGRWNIERLLLGWRFAETKDVARKLSPYLVPWEALTAEIQGYDVDAMRTLPAKFREAGLEVYRL